MSAPPKSRCIIYPAHRAALDLGFGVFSLYMTVPLSILGQPPNKFQEIYKISIVGIPISIILHLFAAIWTMLGLLAFAPLLIFTQDYMRGFNVDESSSCGQIALAWLVHVPLIAANTWAILYLFHLILD